MQDKYRPILNLSAPKSNAFNEHICDDRMNRVIMSSPVLVAKKLVKFGSGAWISKIDHSSAYKLIPVKYGHLWLQGFVWMGKIFIETSQIFGARSAVPNYDRFHFCLAEIVKFHGREYAILYERQLDDMIMMAATYSECKYITDVYLKCAERINLPLASFDNPMKAFLNSQYGVILGIYFDTRNMTWSLPLDKSDKYLFTIYSVLQKETVSQKELQQVLGVINNVAQMSHSLKFFRDPIVLDLKRTYENVDQTVILSSDCRKFLYIWLQIISDLRHGFPIPTAPSFPPAQHFCFATDAAGGAALSKGADFEVGVGAVGFISPWDTRIEHIFYTGQVFWPRDFVTIMRDRSDRLFGNKTTCLEVIGVFIPLYHNICTIVNRPVRVLVDNVAVFWAYEKGRSRKDPYTSMFVFILNMLATTLNFYLYIDHVRRVSTFPALLADTFTRTDEKGRNLIKDHPLDIHRSWPPSLYEWMQNPVVDWTLGTRILNDFRAILSG